MSNSSMLTVIKLVHTIVWVIFVGLIGIVTWSGVTANLSKWSWWAAVLVLGEVLVLGIFGGSCPLTKIARRYSDSDRSNFDIFLPNWLAEHNKQIFGSIFLVGLGLMLFHYVNHN